MPIALDPGRKPLDVKIHVKTNAGVDITWADGHVSHYDFEYLRKECPCATCNDEREKKSQMDSKTPSSPALPMFKAKPRATAATRVGNYAIQISFSDGHSTGIYSWDHLRALCRCPFCVSVSS